MSNVQKFQQQEQEFQYYKHLALVAAKSGSHTLSAEALMNIMLTAKDLGISPMKAINGGFYIVNGKISMSTALMADRIRKDGHSIKIPEWTDEKCAIIGVRKDNGDSIRFEFTIKDAERAGLTRSQTWVKFPKQMLYNRAMATLARVLFPDVVGNCYSEDEKYDIMDVAPERRPLEDDNAHVMFARVEDAERVEKTITLEPTIENLKEALCKDGVETGYLEEYVTMLCNKKNQPMKEIIKSAMLPQILPRFKEAYSKEHKKQKEAIPA